MIIVPGQCIGSLRFLSSQREVCEQLGPPGHRHDYGDGRERWDYPQSNVLFLEGYGVMSVSLEHGPAMLWDTDVFGLSVPQLIAWLGHHEVQARVEYICRSCGDLTVEASSLGLSVYYFDDEGEESMPEGLEISVVEWARGTLVQHPEASTPPGS